MRCLLQRVNKADVMVEGIVTGAIEKGLLIYLAVLDSDSEETVKRMVLKTVNLRVFPDAFEKMNLSLLDKGYSCLLISQFTLYSDCKKGNRPFYGKAAKPETANYLYEIFQKELKKFCPCPTGVFGSHMKIRVENDGPVTILLDSDEI